MIETITGIYKILGNVTKLDLRSNRIENLCGLERLYSLEYVNIRENQLIDWAEVTRMTELPEIRQICVDATETPVQNADPNSTQTLPADPNSTQTVPADPDSTQTAPAQNSDSSDVPGTTVQTNVGPIIAVSLVAFFIIVLLLAALFFTRRKKQQINNYNIKADQVRIPEDNA
ncbi:14569_t:CDS:2 [Entrophospora sp. SA101]|nr:14569_t:CDS:2 [Entrophospora sp. SA101]